MASSSPDTDVLVVGGGNAAMCAALAAHDAGATVAVLEAAPKAFRGGNSRHTRDIRAAHIGADEYVTAGYSASEFAADLRSVTGGATNETLVALTIAESSSIPEWMTAHGVRWQRPLTGTLSLARTNYFFLGGGKALINTYYRAAEARGLRIFYDTAVEKVEIEDDTCRAVTAITDGQRTRIAARAVVVASGGFEANRDWLRKHWGDRVANFVVRGTPYNQGHPLRSLLDSGIRQVGELTGAHAVAVDARAPASDGGIVTRLDAIPLGIVVNRLGARFYDEGEDLWPKRYATWGSLIADQPDQIACVIFDTRTHGLHIPGMYRPYSAMSLDKLVDLVGLPRAATLSTIARFNRSCSSDGELNPTRLDGRSTSGIAPPKSNWALPIADPPFYAYLLRPGITFTYAGVEVDSSARIVRDDGTAVQNLFAAGEIMAGNILSRGYLAGFGLTIGTVFGRIAGAEAAKCSR